LGVDMTTPANGFYVYDIEKDVFKRFKDILGQDFEQRFYPYSITFEQAVKQTVPVELGIGMRTIPQILNIKDDSSNVISSFVPRG